MSSPQHDVHDVHNEHHEDEHDVGDADMEDYGVETTSLLTCTILAF